MPAELCEPPYKTALCPVQASHHSQHKSKEHTWIKHWILLVQQFSTHQKQTQKCTFLFPMLHEISTCGKLPSKVICTAKSETIRVSTEINWFYIVLAEHRYLRLVYRYRLVVPPGTNIKVTTRYLWRALGTGWYCTQPVPKAHSKILSTPKVPIWRWTGTYAGVDLRLVF